MAGLPKSWQAGLILIAKYGPMSIIALGLVYWFTVKQDAKLDRIADDMSAHRQTTAELVTHLQEEAQQSWQLVAISQRICLNTAKSDADRLNCVVTGRTK